MSYSLRDISSWYESSARQRITGLIDPHSFTEFIGPQERETSPHLKIFDLPEQFDDGIVIGAATVSGTSVLIAAQEGRFMGGAFGEVHGAKLLGLLRAAKELNRHVIICFDTGGVRLQEANAGEISIAEIMRAIMDARHAGLSVIALLGGRSGCYGGGGLIAACCSQLIISEQGRLGVSGPEVIETNRGVEEFDARDRALVWRTMGGKHRYLIGAADVFVDDDITAFRTALVQALKDDQPTLDLDHLQKEQHRLRNRIDRFGALTDGKQVWQALGIEDADRIPSMPTEQFMEIAATFREADNAAR